MQRNFKPTKRFWAAYGSLYGDNVESNTQARGNTRKERSASNISNKPIVPTERDEQYAVVAWLKKNSIPHHHSPNGGRRDLREAASFKRMGTSAGFPDIFIPRKNSTSAGLFIEIKRKSGGKLSESQMIWRDLLLTEGYAWFEAKGAEEFKAIVRNYLSEILP